MMSLSSDEEIALRDVTNAGLLVSDRISRDVSARVDLEEALEASRYASHPYTTHPKEVISFYFFLGFFDFFCGFCFVLFV